MNHVYKKTYKTLMIYPPGSNIIDTLAQFWFQSGFNFTFGSEYMFMYVDSLLANISVLKWNELISIYIVPVPVPVSWFHK